MLAVRRRVLRSAERIGYTSHTGAPLSITECRDYAVLLIRVIFKAYSSSWDSNLLRKEYVYLTGSEVHKSSVAPVVDAPEKVEN